jgi:hypothetical protein
MSEVAQRVGEAAIRALEPIPGFRDWLAGLDDESYATAAQMVGRASIHEMRAATGELRTAARLLDEGR